MWILMLMLATNGGGNLVVKDIKGFTTQATCQAAGIAFESNVGTSQGYYCVEVQ